MLELSAAARQLAALPNITVALEAPLACHTRFGIGGPAAVLCRSSDQSAFACALRLVKASQLPGMVLGGGSNLVVADRGFAGIVLQFTGSRIERQGDTLRAEAGALLQDVVDTSIACGLEGIETMTGIPGNVGGAVYGNAGAYGHSLQEVIQQVSFTEGEAVRHFSKRECQFAYRESIFKERKEWVILSADLLFRDGDPAALKKTAGEIRTVRDAKYPPSMKCAGSIFKNVFLADLPQTVQAIVPPVLVRDGKIPSAWFLEQTGVKGLRRGDIQVAAYHANLIYNDGAGTAADLTWVIEELKRRVRDQFGFELQEEVQYVGFNEAGKPL